jgi:hypothetical protein
VVCSCVWWWCCLRLGLKVLFCEVVVVLLHIWFFFCRLFLLLSRCGALFGLVLLGGGVLRSCPSVRVFSIKLLRDVA